HIGEGGLLEVGAALRTLHEMAAPVALAALLVEARAHLFDQLRALAREVLVLVPSWVIVRVSMHTPPAGTIRRQLGAWWRPLNPHRESVVSPGCGACR